MRISRREFNLILILVMFVGSSLYYVYLLDPVLSSYMEIHRQNKQMMTAVQQVQGGLLNPESTLTLSLESYQEYLYKIPEKPYGPELVAFMSDVARESNVLIKNIHVNYPLVMPISQPIGEKEEEQNRLPEIIPIDIELEGVYYNLMTFLLKLENTDRLYAVRDLSFISGRKTYETLSNSTDTASFTNNTAPTRLAANRILLRVKVNAYYDPDNPLDMKGIIKEVYPSPQGKNPFIQ